MSQLFERRHLGRQEEAIDESGVQLRMDDPANPVPNQTWINMSQNKLKTYDGTNTHILVEGEIGASIEVPPSNIMDISKSRAYHKTVTGNFTVEDITNFVEGQTIRLLVKNTNPNIAEVTSITLAAPSLIPNSSYFFINSANNVNKYYVWIDYDGLGSNPNIVDRTGVRVLTSAGLREKSSVTIPNTGADSITSGEYFLVNSALNADEFYVWYNKESAGGSPLLPDKTGIQVAIGSLDSAEVVAEKTKDAINAVAGLSAVQTGATITIECTAVGPTNAVANGNISGLIVDRLTVGKNPDTPVELATKVAAALNALPDFNVPVPSTTTITVTNTEAGFTENATNISMGTNVSVNVVTEGSGRVSVIFPSNFILDLNATEFVEGSSSKLFQLIKLGASVLVLDMGTFAN